MGALIGLVRLELAAGNVAEAQAHLDGIVASGIERTGAQMGLVLYVQSRLELAKEQPARALTTLDTAARVMREQGFTEGVAPMIEVDRMQLLHALGRFDESRACGERLASMEGIDACRTAVTSGLLAADASWDDDRDAALVALRTHLRVAAERQVVNFVALLPRVAARIALRALEHDVEPEFVRRAIRARALPPPPAASSAWPWPLRVELLGAFSILVDGVPLRFSGKAQAKPLELLKYLACERSMGADFASIADALWPDSDGASGRKSLEVTISRLRKLLGDETFLQVKEGKVVLDPVRVSADARDFLDLCTQCEALVARETTAARAGELGQRLLALFKSLPLEHEETLPWSEGVREAYRAALVRAGRAVAAAMERDGSAIGAIELLEAAVAREPLAEGLYQVLIRSYTRSGQSAEAMRVYRQCRRMLSLLIGAAPCSETERLKQAIPLKGPDP